MADGWGPALARAQAARERAETATSGPWRQSVDTPWGSKVIINESGEFYVGVSAHTTPPGEGWSAEARERAHELGRNKCADAAFVAHARTDVPALAADLEAAIARIRELEQEVDRQFDRGYDAGARGGPSFGGCR